MTSRLSFTQFLAEKQQKPFLSISVGVSASEENLKSLSSYLKSATHVDTKGTKLNPSSDDVEMVVDLIGSPNFNLDSNIAPSAQLQTKKKALKQELERLFNAKVSITSYLG